MKRPEPSILLGEDTFVYNHFGEEFDVIDDDYPDEVLKRRNAEESLMNGYTCTVNQTPDRCDYACKFCLYGFKLR